MSGCLLSRKQKITNVDKDMEKLDPCSLLVETQNSVSAIEKSIKIPQEIKTTL